MPAAAGPDDDPALVSAAAAAAAKNGSSIGPLLLTAADASSAATICKAQQQQPAASLPSSCCCCHKQALQQASHAVAQTPPKHAATVPCAAAKGLHPSCQHPSTRLSTAQPSPQPHTALQYQKHKPYAPSLHPNHNRDTHRCLVEFIRHGAEVSCMLPHQHSTACHSSLCQVVARAALQQAAANECHLRHTVTAAASDNQRRQHQQPKQQCSTDPRHACMPADSCSAGGGCLLPGFLRCDCMCLSCAGEQAGNRGTCKRVSVCRQAGQGNKSS